MSEQDENRPPNKHSLSRLEEGFEKIIGPFQSFVKDQSIASIILLCSAILALLIANSSLADFYQSLLHTQTGFVFGEWSFQKSIHDWINEALMTLFFFVIGLEMKRDFLVGELHDPRNSVQVVISAAGGMLIPALIFYAFNSGSSTVHGWGIPMATDTAFAVGFLYLLGNRIPRTLTTFLTALAIIDDLGAIAVIAVFYSDSISFVHLGFAALFLIILIIINLLGFRRPWLYFFPALAVWLFLGDSGVHVTLTGVLVAMTIPARPKRNPRWFIQKAHRLTNKFEEIESNKKRAKSILADEEQDTLAARLEDVAEKATTPLQRWERKLEHPVALLVLPVFALANAGITIDGSSFLASISSPLSLGIIFGLTFGKCIGITCFCWISQKLKLGVLPKGVTMSHIIGVSLMAGIGFSMSIFIANLGFDDKPDKLLIAKSAIFIGSLIAGVLGYCWLRFLTLAQKK